MTEPFDLLGRRGKRGGVGGSDDSLPGRGTTVRPRDNGDCQGGLRGRDEEQRTRSMGSRDGVTKYEVQKQGKEIARKARPSGSQARKQRRRPHYKKGSAHEGIVPSAVVENSSGNCTVTESSNELYEWGKEGATRPSDTGRD